VNPARFAFRAIACLVLLSPPARLLAAGDIDRTIAANPIALASNDNDDNWEVVPSPEDSRPAASAASGAVASQGTEDSEGDPALGPADAPVTIVEFSEFPCPFCRLAADTLKRVREKYGERVRLVHKDFPLAMHGQANGAAIAARCAGAQGQYWAYRDALFAGHSGLAPADLKAVAESLGLDTAGFDSCCDSDRYRDKIEADVAEGTRLGVSGTPTFMIGGQRYVGNLSFQAFCAAIDKQLASARN
jgi:protein-disulfide isomerase